MGAVLDLNRERQRRYAAWLVKEAKSRARQRGLEFSITQADISIPEKCPVLGIPLSLDCRGRPGPGSPSLDRIDSSRGYIPGNVVVISWRANRLKSDATVDELRKLLQWFEGKV